MMLRAQLKNSIRNVRQFSESAKPAALPAAKSGGSSLVQRVSAFIVGTAVGFGANMYLVHEELIESNKRFERTLQTIQDELKTCAKK